MKICYGYENDCVCEDMCLPKREEFVATESIRLIKKLEELLEKLIKKQPEHSKQENIGFFKKLMMRCSQYCKK